MFCRKFDSWRILKILSNILYVCRILKILSNMLYAIEYSYGLPEVSTIYLTFSIAYLIYSTAQYAQGSSWPKLAEHESQLFLYVTRRVYAGQMCVVLLTPFAYLVQCLKRVQFFFLLYFLAHFFSLPTYQRCRWCSNSTILLLYCLVF